MGLFSKLKGIFFPSQQELNPESKWIVKVTDEMVSTIDFEKLNNSIMISEIDDVTIFTNDSGPVGIDLWWRLSGNGKLLFVPGGATGEQEMLHRLQKLSDFNNEELIRAMGSTDNAEFLIWKKK